MKLTESQIRQIVQSSIEANKPRKTHRITEQQLRYAIRHHIKTGQPLNEGIFSAFKDLLGGIVGGFVDGFKDAFGEFQGKVAAEESKAKQEMSDAIGGDFPDMDNLDPAASDNDKLGVVYYMTFMVDLAREGSEAATGIDLDSKPYGGPNAADDDGWVDIFAKTNSMNRMSRCSGPVMSILERLQNHIPEARAAFKDLEAASGGSDPLEICTAVLASYAILTDEIMPQLTELAALADKAPGPLKSQINERKFALEDMGEAFDAAKSHLEQVEAAWQANKDESEEVIEDAMEEAGEEPDEEGTEGEGEETEGEETEGEGEGEESAEVPAVAFGAEGAEQDDGNEEEEKKNESVFRHRGLVISEAKLRKIVRRSLIAHKNQK